MGFISDLPHELVAAFRATLEEVLEADIVVHVRDISHPDSVQQASDVEEVLRDLGVGEKVDAGLIEALNKIDLMDDESRLEVINQAKRSPNTIAISAKTGAGVDVLLAKLDMQMTQDHEILDVTLPLSQGAELAWLYRNGEVIARTDDEHSAQIRVRMSPEQAQRFRQRNQGIDS